MPDQSFTITRKNNATEKEGIQYMESLGQGAAADSGAARTT